MAKKKTRKKKVGVPKSKIMSAVRRIWLYSDSRKEAAKRDVTSDGYSRCEKCKSLTEEYALDHVDAVVPLTGFTTYDSAFERLFCDASGLQKLCHRCHGFKSSFEISERKRNRALKKGLANTEEE